MRTIFYFILTIVFTLISCRYDPKGENFIELNPPDDVAVIEISLNNINPSDTIYMYRDMQIFIKLNAEDKKLKETTIYLDEDMYSRSWSNSIDFYLRLDNMSEGVHTLTVNAVFFSGSGSLAEIMGLEGYVGEITWNIRVIHDIESHFNVDHRLNEDGFLEIFWNNAIPENAIKKYAVRVSGSNKDSIINDPTQKSFIDYEYVCGSAYYEVQTYLKSGYSYMKKLSFEKPTPTLYIEEMGVHQLRMYWDKPFANGRFSLEESNYGIISSDINDTTIIISQVFGRYRDFSLSVRPQKSNNYKYCSSCSFCQGFVLGLPNFDLYSYNTLDNIIYSRKYEKLVAFNASTLQEINSITIKGNPWGFAYGGRIASAPHNSTVAAMTGEETWIFTDSRFINPIIIPDLPGDVNTRLCELTSDGRFFEVTGVPFEYSKTCKVFNAKTGNKIFDFSFTHGVISYSYPNRVTVSEDGRYFFAANVNGMELFEINGTTVNLLRSDARQYSGAMFVANQPDKLLIKVDSDIELRQIPSFSLIQKFNVGEKGATLCNIDPKTGYLLYHQNDSLKVAHINNITKTLLQLRSDETWCRLLNNKILTIGKGGIVLDISPYL